MNNSEDSILWQILDCNGANKPHHDISFSSAKCPNCNKVSMSTEDFILSKIKYIEPKFSDVFTCYECKESMTRYQLFIKSLDDNDNWDIARKIIFTPDSEDKPNQYLWYRVDQARQAIVKNGLKDSKAEDIALNQARCYCCLSTDDLTVTFDYTNIKPFYVCKKDVWMIGGF